MTAIYFAPMESVTTGLYRRIHQKYFSGVDKYYTPFISVNQSHHFKKREERELTSGEDQTRLVPQIMTKSPEDFRWAAEALLKRGYHEMNLNTGCPSATVVTKEKGAGMLKDPRKLDAFFYDVFAGMPEGMQLGIKSRVGMKAEEELPALIDIWNRYPFREIIIHPRLREDYYNGKPRMNLFRECIRGCRASVCYNGDINSVSDFLALKAAFPEVSAVMIGRGLIADPALAREIKGGEPLNAEELKQFHEELLQGYRELLSGERDVLFKMKDLWTYMSRSFQDGDEILKRIRRSRNLSEYHRAVETAWSSFRAKRLQAGNS